jgi:hypothetical protein
MANPLKQPQGVLENLRDSSAIGYLGSYFTMMGRAIGVDITENMDDLRTMIVDATGPMNDATEAVWRALMADDEWELALERFRDRLKGLHADVKERRAEPQAPKLYRPVFAGKASTGGEIVVYKHEDGSLHILRPDGEFYAINEGKAVWSMWDDEEKPDVYHFKLVSEVWSGMATGTKIDLMNASAL